MRILQGAAISRVTDLVGGADQKAVAILSGGVAFAYRYTQDGERHISSIFYPGDIVNYSALLGLPPRYQVCGKSACFTLVGLSDFRTALQADADFEFAISRLERIRANFETDRFCAAVRASARTRLLRLLLECKAREEISVSMRSDVLKLWFTQREVGDMTGLTPVYVSKVLGQLQQEGHIRRDRGLLHFADRASLESQCNFVNHFQSAPLSANSAFRGTTQPAA